MNAVIVSIASSLRSSSCPVAKRPPVGGIKGAALDLVGRLYSTDPARRIADSFVLCCDLKALPHAVVS
jgi:hypothetical protein